MARLYVRAGRCRSACGSVRSGAASVCARARLHGPGSAWRGAALGQGGGAGARALRRARAQAGQERGAGAGQARRVGVRQRRGRAGRARQGRKEGRKEEKKMGKRKRKGGEGERKNEREMERFAPRSRRRSATHNVACAHGRGHREAVGGWKSDAWNRERFRKIGSGVYGGFELNDEKFCK